MYLPTTYPELASFPGSTLYASTEKRGGAWDILARDIRNVTFTWTPLTATPTLFFPMPRL